MNQESGGQRARPLITTRCPDKGAAAKPTVGRIGVRVVRAPDRTGVNREILLDPSDFRCSAVAGELADEWAEYVEAAELSGAWATATRRAVHDFCHHVDSVLGEHAHRASLVRPYPDVAAVLAEWERTLPARFRAGSATPSTLAASVRSLIARRARHEQRPVADGLRRLVDGAVGVAWGHSEEVDEFSRKDKRMLVRAAWEWVNQLDARLAAGRAAAAGGRHPADGRWTDAGNLLGAWPTGRSAHARSAKTSPWSMSGQLGCGPASSHPISRSSLRGRRRFSSAGWSTSSFPITWTCMPIGFCWSRPPATLPRRSPR
jgi:hypothetical protein